MKKRAFAAAPTGWRFANFTSRYKSLHKKLINLTSSPTEKLRRFKGNLTALRRSTKMIWVRDPYAFAEELRDIVELLCDKDTPPREGVDP